MTGGVFITGTDTGVGKTRFTIALMRALKKSGIKVSGMKPIASGAHKTNGILMNDDAERIRCNCSDSLPYELVNPVIFEPPVAPHIAASNAGMDIDLGRIVSGYEKLKARSEFVVVEGVGGWRVPVSDNALLTDLVQALDLPVILVVGLRLGCINHALLTAEAVTKDGLKLTGWVGNVIDKDYLYKQDTINTLKQRLIAPHIMDMDYVEDLHRDNLIGRRQLKRVLERLAIQGSPDLTSGSVNR